MDTERLPTIIEQLFGLVEELETMFEGRHFTVDGHLLGSIGEVIAAHCYGVELVTASTKGYDATIGGKKVEIKVTQANQVAFRSCPEHALVLKIEKNGAVEEIYNGDGRRIWEVFSGRPKPSNGQYQISLGRLRELASQIAEEESVPMIRAFPRAAQARH